MVCSGRPKGNIMLDFTEQHVGKNAHKFVIKEGTVYNLRVHFIVRYDIVYGLKMVNNVYKTFMKGAYITIQSRKIRRKSDPMRPHPPTSRMCLISLWRRHRRGSWPEGTTKARHWYPGCNLVRGLGGHSALSIRLCASNRQGLELTNPWCHL